MAGAQGPHHPSQRLTPGRDNPKRGMTDGRWWIALVTFKRGDEQQDILADWAQGACGWMVALAPDEDTTRALILRDVEYQGLRVLEIADEEEVFGEDEIDKIDGHLGASFRDIELGKQTIWGTIHCYKGEGEAGPEILFRPIAATACGGLQFH